MAFRSSPTIRKSRRESFRDTEGPKATAIMLDAACPESIGIEERSITAHTETESQQIYVQ
jgi:hypothetical protein